jgi:hypothetical protein
MYRTCMDIFLAYKGLNFVTKNYTCLYNLSTGPGHYTELCNG